MTYKKIKTEATFRNINGSTMKSICTLLDEYGGKAQIAIDDRCYVLFLKRKNNCYVSITHWFPEAVKELKKLPSPNK